jgi:NAD-dependent histone deacetylase SIR2
LETSPHTNTFCVLQAFVHKDYLYDIQIILQEIPKCPSCGSYIKPDIVFFGERLVDRFYECREKDFRALDLLLIIGTSLTVAPVNQLIQKFCRAKCSKFLINREVVAADSFTPNCHSRSGSALHGLYQGDCDEVILKLAAYLGWEDELRALEDEAVLSNIVMEDGD